VLHAAWRQKRSAAGLLRTVAAVVTGKVSHGEPTHGSLFRNQKIGRRYSAWLTRVGNASVKAEQSKQGSPLGHTCMNRHWAFLYWPCIGRLQVTRQI
jgi:hypothetical protein